MTDLVATKSKLSVLEWVALVTVAINGFGALLTGLMSVLFAGWTFEHPLFGIVSVFGNLAAAVSAFIAVRLILRRVTRKASIAMAIMFAFTLACAIANMFELGATLPLINLIQICLVGFCDFSGSPYQQPWFTIYVLQGLSFYLLPVFALLLMRKPKGN